MTSMFGALSKLIESHTEPLFAVSMFGFVFLVALGLIRAAQTRVMIRKRAVAINPAFARATGSVQPTDSSTRGRHNVEDVSELLFAVERGLGASYQERISK